MNKNDLIIIKNSAPIIKEYSNGVVIFIDENKPIWVKTTITGKWIYEQIRKSPMQYEELIKKVVNHYSLPEETIKESVDALLMQLKANEFIKVEMAGNNMDGNVHEGSGCDNIEVCNNDQIVQYGLNTVWLNILSQCNLKCQHCFLPENKTSPIKLSDAKYIIDQIAENNAKRVVISGGEPFIHHEIIDILKYIHEKKTLEVIVITNGTIHDDKTLKEIINYVDYFQISLDGINEDTHDAIRGKGTFKKAISLFKTLYELNAKSKRAISFTPHPSNIHQIPMLLKLGVELQADAVYLTKPKKPARYDYDEREYKYQYQTLEFRKELYKQFDKMLGEYYKGKKAHAAFNIKYPEIDAQFDPAVNLLVPVKKACCGAGGGTLFINEEGRCYPCVALSVDENNCLGNIFDNTLEYIYKNRAIMGFRQEIHIDNIEECKKCEYKYFCAGDCRALGEDIRKPTPFCAIVKERYERFLENVAIPKN